MLTTRSRSWWTRLVAESGFKALADSCRDTKVLCLLRFVRLFAYGASFLILVHYLSGLKFSDEQIGLFMTLTLLGDVVIGSLLTLITDQVGRRLILGIGAALMAVSGLVFAVSSNYWLLLIASVVGVISPSGNEIGPFRAIEESILAHLTVKEQRSDIFAWYTLCGTAGAAIGTLSSGWIVQGARKFLHNTTKAQRVVFVLYAVLGFVKLLLTFSLSSAVELERPETRYEEISFELEEEGLITDDEEDDGDARLSPSPKTTVLQRLRGLFPYISPVSRSILYRLLLLFSLDSFASGIASPSWLTYFFTTVHSIQPWALGTLFLVTNLLATLSNLLALPIARRIGPLRTMVFTHLPSAFFLAMIPLPSATVSGHWFSMAFLAIRACMQSMDQAPRQAFLAAAVLPAERTAVLGLVNTVKTFAQAGGLGFAGLLASKQWWVLAFGGAGLMKAAYDFLLLWMFLGLPDREATTT
ncbi:major facilitator superfamily transporter [Podospora didyma]|uniref:Major facilitator superfamily transporter n=1 Tax=Podospora didyma TaxID=330526 RepID=A0AAE0NWS5_9PEZI|nr:major facilitator superfamily transporter [Podospora didyma]